MNDCVLYPLEDETPFLSRWSELYERAEEPNFYLSPAWISAWLRCLPKNVTAHVVESRVGERAVAMAVVGQRRMRFSAITGRALHLHETGNPIYDRIYIEYNDFLRVSGASADFTSRMIEALFSSELNAEEIVFRNARPHLASAAQTAAANMSARIAPLSVQPTYGVDLAARRRRGDNFIDSMRGSLGAKTRRAFKAYRQRGAVYGRIAATQQEKEEAWKLLIKLHEAGWRRKGRPGVFSNALLTAFHEELRRQAPQETELFVVYNGDLPIGVLYNFNHQGRVLNYQSGFLFEDDNKLTPGFVSHALACDHYMKNDVAYYDMLVGDADYKRRFGAPGENLTSFVLQKSNWRIAMRRTFKSLRV